MLKKHIPSVVILVIALILIFFPVMHGISWKNFVLSSRFSIPDAPSISFASGKDIVNTNQRVNPYYFYVGRENAADVIKLKQLGWPAYIDHNQLKIGPFLDAKKKADYQKELSDLLQQDVQVENFDIVN